MSATLSIILVDYKTTALARARCDALAHAGWECIVVDNNTHNRGYGAGINYGVHRSHGELLLFLNPDVETAPHDVERLVEYLSIHEDVAAVGPQFVDEDGNVVPSCLGELSWWGGFVGLSFLQKLWEGNPVGASFWLPHWKRDSKRAVATINGACMLVRRADFEQVGGFDESFFLYWEENDLCDRLRTGGKRIVFLPTVRVKHTLGVSMQQSETDVSRYFVTSRNLYLRKRFGNELGTILNLWLWISEAWAQILVFLVALVPRIALPDHISLIGDVGRDYLRALDMGMGNGIPLLGIPSSVPRFSQGPLNVWFAAIAFFFAGISPIVPVIFAGVVTSIGVVFLYRLLAKATDRLAAFAASLIWATSPAAIFQSRMPFYLFAVPVVLVLYMRSLVQLSRKTPWTVFMAAFSFFLLFQWELATIPLITLLFYGLYRNRIALRTALMPLILGISVGLFPQILFDLSHRCAQVCGFVVWMGYRTVATTGFDGRHSMTISGLTHLLGATWTQGEQLLSWGTWYGLVLVLVLACISIFSLKRKKHVDLVVYAWIGTISLFAGLLIHGDPSESYFPPFLTLIPILVGFGIHNLPRGVQRILVIVVTIASLFTVVHLLRVQFGVPSVVGRIEEVRQKVKAAAGAPVPISPIAGKVRFPTDGDDERFLIRMSGGKVEVR